MEDMRHIRELLDNQSPSPGEVRRLSGVLRRLLVENDLRSIAPPRIGAISIISPDNNYVYHAARKQSLFIFASGGINVFNCRFRAIVGSEGNQPIDASFDRNKTVPLSIDGFLNQKALCFKNEWATRRQAIKYVANFASGVHSSTPITSEEKILARLRQFTKLSAHESGGAQISVEWSALVDTNLDTPFKWARDAVDLVLIEILSAAYFLSSSPDIKVLEAAIVEELK